MEDKLISYDTAKLAKKLGFPQEDYPCYSDDSQIHTVGYFLSNSKKNEYYASTQSLLQKWLREIKEENIVPPLWFSYQGYACDIMGFDNTEYFKTYEEALENELHECLQRISETVA